MAKGKNGSGIVWDAQSQRAFEAALKRGLDGYKVRTEQDLARVALAIQNVGRQLAPVDTGRLRASWKAGSVVNTGRSMYVEVGTNVLYAPYVEFGTRRMRPQPFARPAFMKALSEWGR